MAKPLDWKSHWSAVRAHALNPAGHRIRNWHAWLETHDPVYRGFRHPGPAEIWAAGITLLLIAATVVFLLLFDWNWLRGPVGRWASTAYDREIELNGDLDVNLFSWTPSVRVRDLRVGGPNWAPARDTLRVDDLLVTARMRRLLAGQVEIPLLSITRPELVLIADETGRTSWSLNPDQPDRGQATKLPPIHRLVITDGTVSLDEQRRNVKLEARITAREGSGERAGFHLQGDGTLNGTPLTLSVRGGPFINIRRNRPYAFKAELAGVNSRLKADGSITRPFDLGQFNATLSLEGQNMADLYLLTGITLPNTPRYRLSGALSRDDARYRFKDFSGRVGSSDLSGQIEVDKAGDRRRVTATLRSRSLDIDDLITVLGATPQVGAGGTTVTSGTPGRLLPDAPLQASRLQAMDGTLSYRAASVKRNDLEIRRVHLEAGLDGGVLKLDPVAFTFSRGELNGTARIDARKAVPYSTIDFRLSGYPLESIIPTRNGAPTITGLALGRARLEGPGASVHDLASNARGTISLVVPRGEIRKAFAELLGINIGRGLSLLLSGDRSTAEIRCAVADFDVSGGTATARTFVIDTDVVLAKGAGTIDLGSETLDLRIDGETKQPRLLRVWAPITVTGQLAAPKPGVDGAAVAGQVGLAGVIASLVNPLAAILPFVDPGLAEDANCGALIAGAR